MIEDHWYRANLTWVTLLLLPLSWLFACLVYLRRFFYRVGLLKSHAFPVPVIVVGNITVGGTGKTPFVIWLANFLKAEGYQPGIVSRGIGGQQQTKPYEVLITSDPAIVGDEALLLVRRSLCPMMVSVDRASAVNALLSKHSCDVVISDDGLQHYRMQRQIEILMIDGERGLGNQQLLPAGPLREPVSRLKSVHFIVRQGEPKTGEYGMELYGDTLVSLIDSATRPLTDWIETTVHAIAGIGHPERFFKTLKRYQINLKEHIFPDHYRYQKNDLDFDDDLPILMTEKDAVKCTSFADHRFWYLPVDAMVSGGLGEQLLMKLKRGLSAV